MNIQEIPIESIQVAKDRQLTDASTVPTLAESIKKRYHGRMAVGSSGHPRSR